MSFTLVELREAKRQIDSIIHKLNETVKTLESKDSPERYKSQLTLAKRRIKALTISGELIKNELKRNDIQN